MIKQKGHTTWQKIKSFKLDNKVKENTKNDVSQKQELPTARHKLPLNKK